MWAVIALFCLIGFLAWLASKTKTRHDQHGCDQALDLVSAATHQYYTKILLEKEKEINSLKTRIAELESRSSTLEN